MRSSLVKELQTRRRVKFSSGTINKENKKPITICYGRKSLKADSLKHNEQTENRSSKKLAPKNSFKKLKDKMITKNKEEIIQRRHSEIEKFWRLFERKANLQINRGSEKLLMNSGNEYIDKIEDIKNKSKLLKQADLYGNQYWQMTLRGNQRTQSEGYFPIGRFPNALYSSKSFNQELTILSSSKQKKASVELKLDGISKLNLEHTALKNVGQHYLDFSLLDNTIHPEEAILKQYDKAKDIIA